jgi:hypothetical protein
MHRILFFLLMASSQLALAQIEITWETLEDVEFSDRYFEEVDETYLYPHFGPSVMALAGQEVTLKGFILALEPQEGYYVLSKSPFSSCFFCGAGGPETVVELELKSDKDYFIMDEVVTMKGVFRLNSDDIYKCNYILEVAEVHKR